MRAFVERFRRIRAANASHNDYLPQGRRTLAMGLSFVICITAGLMIGTSTMVARGTDLRGGRHSDLISLVRTESGNNSALAEEVSRTRAEVDRLSRAQRSRADPLDVDAAAATAHTVPVSGPGVTVTLDDAPGSVAPPGVDADLLIVHQQDIQAVVNALWAGGAEAMTIQDQRIVSTTGIKCVGNTVVLQGIPYAPPYRIQAVGDPDALEAALATSPYVANYQEYADAYGLGYAQRRDVRLDMPAFSGGVEPAYASATPVED